MKLTKIEISALAAKLHREISDNIDKVNQRKIKDYKFTKKEIEIIKELENFFELEKKYENEKTRIEKILDNDDLYNGYHLPNIVQLKERIIKSKIKLFTVPVQKIIEEEIILNSIDTINLEELVLTIKNKFDVTNNK